MLQRKLESVGVKVELRYRGDGKSGHANIQEFLIDFLRDPPAGSQPPSNVAP
jgi:hypothetical protein